MIESKLPDFESIKEAIRTRALAEGFDVCGFGPAEIPVRNQARYRQFVANGEHGSMGWMAERMDQRIAPTTLWHDARSVMVVGQNYAPADDPRADWKARLDDPHHAHISAYARGRDYHDVLKKRLKRVGRWLVQEYAGLTPQPEIKVFVDTAPVPEKALAQMAGVGWQGKHTNLVSQNFGSYLFLGVMYLSLDLPPDNPARPHPDQCGSCTACIDICPTGAIEAAYTLNATKCIAYWNIEHKPSDDPIPSAIAEQMGNRVYGCDDCIAVCPWNKFVGQTTEPAFAPKPATDSARLDQLDTLGDTEFRTLFAQTPVKRIGVEKFTQGVKIAQINTAKGVET